jgi:hypothetical protein
MENHMTSRDLLRRVLERDHPERIGLTFPEYNGRPRLNDHLGTGPAPAPGHEERDWQPDGAGGETYRDEWGLVWRRIPGKGARGEVVEAPIKQWSDLDTYQLPSLDDPARYEQCARTRADHPDEYLLGGICACAFNTARYLRRVEQYLLDCAAEPEQVRRLNALVNDLAIRQVEIYADLGADAVMFAEDWGTENRLLVSPRMWDDLFRPGFEKLIAAAHARGLTVWMHCCGYIKDIIPSLHDLGLDLLQLDQPELSGLEFLAQFERMSYWCPVDIQKVLPTGDERLIKSRAREMVRLLGGHGGGFIGGYYGDNVSIGVDPLWQHWAYEVFLEEGQYS